MKKFRGKMKRQNTIILSTLIISLILFTGCSQLKNCGGKCKNATNECLAKAYVYTQPFTSSVGSSSSTSTTTNTPTNPSSSLEAEPNDTFTTSLNSNATTLTSATTIDNGLGGSNSDSYLKNATISSSSDIDIFYTLLSSNISISITQKTGIGNVTCNLYSRDTGTAYFSNSSVPDSSFTLRGTLNTSFSYTARTNIQITFLVICSGTSGTSYSIQVDPYKTSSSSTSLFSSPINVLNYSTFASCAGADASCRKTCSTKL